MGTLDNRNSGKGGSKVRRVGQTSGTYYGQNPRAKTDRPAPKDERP